MGSFKRFFQTYFRILKLGYQVHPGLLILQTVASAAWGLTNLPVLYINKAIVDLVLASIGQPNTEQIFKSLVTIIAVRTVVEIFRNVLSRLQSHISSSFASLMSDRITLILGSQLNSLDVATVESAGFQDRFTKVERQSHQRIWGMLSALSEIPNAVTTLISGIIPILQFNPLISLLVLLSSIPEGIVNGRLAKLEYKNREERNRLYRVLGWLSYIVTDIRQFYENKILGNISYVSTKMHALQDEIYLNDVKQRKTRITWRSLADIPYWLLSSGLNIYYFMQAIVGKISLGYAQMLFQSSQTFANGVGMLMNNIATVYEHYLFVSDYTWFMDLKPQLTPGTTPFPVKIAQGITFDHVSFKYPGTDTWVLQDVSFTIRPSDDIAIVGENGAGKSTLLKLLLGFFPPTQGHITIDGVNIADYNQADYWRHVAFLQQEFHLFPFTARESIAFSDLSRVNDLPAVQAAAKLASIDDYISGLAKGYETPLSKQLDGVEPSGGQQQRIAIARTLFKKSQLMILDEPTSNVDPAAEEEIFDNIIKLTREQILILVSHRFSTVRRADKILVLESGRLVELGTHVALMKKRGLYAKLFTLQAKSYQ